MSAVADVIEFPVKKPRSHGTGSADHQQAEWLAEYLHHEWRYDHGHGRWHHFDGTRWAPDAQESIIHVTAVLASDALEAGVDDEGLRKALRKLLNVNSQKNALEALRSRPDYSTDGNDWDQDANLLGVANGIVDLRTGRLRPGRPDDLVTRTTNVAYNPDARCPTVVQFLKDIFRDHDGNEQPELVDYVLTVLGAALFGHTEPQQFYVSIGPGGAGKGTLYRLVGHVLGGEQEYATYPPSNLYTKPRWGAAPSSAPRADLIELQGRRFAYISEPEPPFDDLTLLGHSGEDHITARPLHSNNVISFRPTHTIMFSTNGRPAISEVGVNMRRRLRVIPFVRTFGDHPDTTLRGKLEAESEGFLNLLVLFAKRYRDDPSVLDLDRAPAVVRDASQAYIEANEPLGEFFREGPASFVTGAKAEAGRLYDGYKDWFRANDQDGDPLSLPKFTKVLEDTYRLTRGKDSRTRRSFWRGVQFDNAHASLDDEEAAA